MAVFRRKTTRGESRYFNYRFMVAGKSFHGSCYDKDGKKATKRTDAEAYEKQIRLKAKEASQQKTIKAIVENFRDELTGGSKILLTEAFDKSMNKPRKQTMSVKHEKAKRGCWLDFVAFLGSHFPGLKHLGEVKKTHAEAYIQQIRTDGKFHKKIEFKSGQKTIRYETKTHGLSNQTSNFYQKALKEIFKLLAEDAGLIGNPFGSIPLLSSNKESREAFTEDELVLIGKNADWFIRSLFAIGMNTALREGDICTLRWDEVDLKEEVITRKMHKTGKVVQIPIMPPLRIVLNECMENHPDSKIYVLPEHAAIYQAGNSGISYRVRKFLESLNIKTQRRVEGRSRAVSVKDVHSLRHTFCFLAGMYGIPLIIVQSIVGHMTPEMTSHYQKHAQMQDKKRMMSVLPDFMQLVPGALRNDGESVLIKEAARDHLLRLARNLDDDKLNDALELLQLLNER